MFGLILVDFLYFGWLFDVFVLSPTPPHPAPPKKRGGGVVWCGVVWCGVFLMLSVLFFLRGGYSCESESEATSAAAFAPLLAASAAASASAFAPLLAASTKFSELRSVPKLGCFFDG